MMPTKTGTLMSQVRWTSGPNIALGAWCWPRSRSDTPTGRRASGTSCSSDSSCCRSPGSGVARPGAHPALSWTNVRLGGWELLAPIAHAYAAVTAAVWNDAITGARDRRPRRVQCCFIGSDPTVTEIRGAWLVCQAVREHRGWLWAAAGIAALAVYGFVATFQSDANFERTRVA